MKTLAKIMSMVTMLGMFGYTMFVFNNMHKEIVRIDRNVHELVSDVYKRQEAANDLLMTENYADKYERY